MSHQQLFDLIYDLHDATEAELMYRFDHHVNIPPKEWANKAGAEYLYSIGEKAPGLVRWDIYFRHAEDPFEHLARLDSAPCRDRLARLRFYSEYKFDRVFAGSDADTHKRIEFLNNQRKIHGDYLCIDPYDGSIERPLITLDTETEKWTRIRGIQAMPSPPIGKPAMIDYETAVERFREFTFDLLSPTHGAEFPWGSVVIAGGSVTKIITAEYGPAAIRGSDIDFFVTGRDFDDRKRNVDAVVAWFDALSRSDRFGGDGGYDNYGVRSGANIFYAIRGSVISVYIRGINRTFQIISSGAVNKYEIISRFDLSHIQWATTGSPYTGDMRFFGTAAALDAISTRITQPTNIGRAKVGRLIKAMRSGYDIARDNKLNTVIDVDALIDPAGRASFDAEYRAILRCYYPPADEEDIVILAQIETDAQATFVTDKPNVALNNVFIGGNFESSYESLLYRAFRVGSLINSAYRRNQRTFMRTRHGQVRIMTDLMILRLIINHTEGNIEIHTEVSDAFAAFVIQLETDGWRVYGGRRQVDVSAINGKIIDWHIPAHRTGNAERSILRTQQGRSLNIAEDLNNDDKIQIMFAVEVVNSGANPKRIRLVPQQIIRYIGEEELAAKAATLADFERAVDEVVAATPAPDAAEGRIEYVDDL